MPDIQRLAELCISDARFDLVRASGPGGQNVNKVATAVQLRFDARASPHLSLEVKRRLLAQAGRRATPSGVVVIHASRHRTQLQNRQDAIERLRRLLLAAATRPKRRIATKATAASRERRLKSKKHRGEIKRWRQDAA